MTDPSSCIAIVGMAGRFPGADDVDELWENLRNGIESIARLSREELIAAGVRRADLEHPRYVNARGVLKDVELFDAEFFAMSPREAALTDPQHRLLLECAWLALEDAGVDPEREGYPIGLFAGTSSDGYLRQQVVPSGLSCDGLQGLEAQLGNEREFACTRVAYKLNLRGPCLTVQTACSTSLVAVQLACQSLLTYQCDLALAGGVSIAFPLRHGYLYQPGHILSPDGRCRAFDAAAQGPVAGDGAGLVALKRLDDALAQGDHVHAVILAAAVNNDGSLKPGFAAPSVHGQAEVIALTHAIAGISSRTIGYVEAHGTGTPLGDPIEVAALTQAFARTSSERAFCALGSLKPNLGHLNTAAGVASLIKTARALSAGEIPPNLHYTTPNTQIDFAQTPFFVSAARQPWPTTSEDGLRRAGVSSFGIGGTNAHVLLEQAPVTASSPPRHAAQLLVVSARSQTALDGACLRLASHLEQRAAWSAAELADVAYTLQVGRRAFAYRRAVVCDGAEEAIAALRTQLRCDPATLDDLAQLTQLGTIASGLLLSIGTTREPTEVATIRAQLVQLGDLWQRGATVDWDALHGGASRRRCALPGYPFQRARHWIDAPLAAEPSVPRAIETVELELKRTLGIRSLESFPGLTQALRTLCAAHVLGYLGRSGVTARADATVSRAALREQLSVLPKFHRLLDAMLSILCDEGWLRVEGGRWRWLRNLADRPDPTQLERALVQRFPQFSGLYDFLAHCSASYQDALSGRVPAISVLYPGGSSELVAGFAQRTAEYRSERVYLGLLTEVVERLRSARAARPLRILEIGGGQGMLTWPLVSKLATANDGAFAYHFTDLGKTFVEDARREASRRGLDHVMTFGSLDIARDPASQMGAAARYDVIVGYNVVHAVRHVPRALTHLQSLLAPGGTLGLVEAVRAAPWDVLTWGLAEGFWQFEDTLRSESVLLSATGWEAALTGAGFMGVTAYPRGAADRVSSDHCLVVAQRGEAKSLSVTPADVGASRSLRPRPALRTPYCSPRSALEEDVARLCQQLFGIERVGVHDDFFELGADSLVTLRLVDMIRSELRLEVPEQAAFQGASVASLVRALSPQRAPTEGPSPLVAIQTQGSRPPFFCVHPVVGVAFGYVGLARALGPDQPFYGFQALGLDGRSQPDARIEDTAARYIEAMRTVAARGPYYLGGYSFGCSIAFQMAQQLIREGERVALLALIDGPAPIARNRPTLKALTQLFALDTFRALVPFLHDYLYLSQVDKRDASGSQSGLSTVLARAMIAQLLPPDSQLLTLQQPAVLSMARQVLHHFRQARAYAPGPYAGPITLLRAVGGRGPTLRAGDATLGWDELAQGGLERHELAAGHFDLLMQPRVQDLAALLADCLRRARELHGADAHDRAHQPHTEQAESVGRRSLPISASAR